MILVIASILLAMPLAALTWAGEARSRGRKARITWIEHDGTLHEAAAREIRFCYFERVYLSVPKNGRTYKDKIHKNRGIPLKKHFVRFGITDTVTFEWSTDQRSGRAELTITTRSARGKITKGRARDLPGAFHPRSPFIGFTVEGLEHRLELLPAGVGKAPVNQPRIIGMKFTP
ncbi:MAG: hypothetical protein ACE5HU_01085 [Acidobacteriota bacterium]